MESPLWSGVIIAVLTVMFLLVPMCLYLYYNREARPDFAKFLRPLIIFGVALMGARLVIFAVQNVIELREWDFIPYWLFGRAILTSGSPYDHQYLLHLAEPFNPSVGLIRELYCWYPPPTQFLFAPLGLFSMPVSLSIWYVLNGLVLAIDVYLLKKVFAVNSGRLGLLVITFFVVMFQSTYETVYFAQSNFIVLLLLLLFWIDRDRPRGGVWLAIGILMKPVLIAVPLYLLMRRQWSSIGAMFATFILSSVLTVMVFGMQSFNDFLFNNTVANDYPSGVAADHINQSIYGILLKIGGYQLSDTPNLFMPLHVALVALVIAVTAVGIIKMHNQKDWALAAVISMAILIYPATMAHYSFLLLIPVMLLWKVLGEQYQRPITALLLITAVYALTTIEIAFAALLLSWLTCLFIGVYYSRKQARELLKET